MYQIGARINAALILLYAARGGLGAMLSDLPWYIQVWVVGACGFGLVVAIQVWVYERRSVWMYSLWVPLQTTGTFAAAWSLGDSVTGSLLTGLIEALFLVIVGLVIATQISRI